MHDGCGLTHYVQLLSLVESNPPNLLSCTFLCKKVECLNCELTFFVLLLLLLSIVEMLSISKLVLLVQNVFCLCTQDFKLGVFTKRIVALILY